MTDNMTAQQLAAAPLDELDVAKVEELLRHRNMRAGEVHNRLQRIEQEIAAALRAGDSGKAAELDQERDRLGWEKKALDQQELRLKMRHKAAEIEAVPATMRAALERLPTALGRLEEARAELLAAASPVSKLVYELQRARQKVRGSEVQGSLPPVDIALATRATDMLVNVLGGGHIHSAIAEAAREAFGLPRPRYSGETSNEYRPQFRT